MESTEFYKLPLVEKALQKLHQLRNEITLTQDRLESLKRQKKEIWAEIGDAAEEYEVEPFYRE